MSELEEKLNALMSNPQLMQQIAAMAQTMGKADPPPAPERKEEPAPASLPDLGMLQPLVQSVGQSRIDSDQLALLHALAPYLNQNRIHKLERAMQAAKLAGLASAFLNSGGLQALTGR